MCCCYLGTLFKQFVIVWQLFEHLFKVFEHFNIFVPDCLCHGCQIPLISSFPTVPFPSKLAKWLHSYSCFCVCSNSLSLFGNCLNTCSKCSNISIYLCWTVCVIGVRFPSFPAFQWCLCCPNWVSGCRVIHVFRLYSTVDL